MPRADTTITLTETGRITVEFLQWLAASIGAWFIFAFIYVAFASMSYPFNFEWMEGQSIDVIQRVMDGKSLYVKPSIEYVPYIYTPLYFYVSALFAEVTGIGFFPARLVSTLAALGSGALIYAWIRKEGGDWRSGVIGAGLFYATYPLSGRWFDNSRVDSLFLCLTLASLFVTTHYKGTKYAIFAGLLGAAAFFIKQSAIVMIAPVLVASLLTDRRQALLTGVVMAALVAAGVLMYDTLTGGWFSFYVFKVPAGHGIDQRMVWGFWRNDMFRAVGIMLAITQGLICLTGVVEWKTGIRYLALALGAIGTAYIARLHGFGWINVLMPAHLMLALMTGLAFAHANRYGNVLVIGLSIPVLLQMAMCLYNPNLLIPSQQSIDAGNRFLADIAKIDGDILMPELQYVQTRVGKPSYALGMAAFDIVRADLKDREDVKRAFMDELTAAIASGRFKAIVPGRIVPLPGLSRYYTYGYALRYPKEYVSGAINFLRTDVFVRIPEVIKPPQCKPCQDQQKNPQK